MKLKNGFPEKNWPGLNLPTINNDVYVGKKKREEKTPFPPTLGSKNGKRRSLETNFPTML